MSIKDVYWRQSVDVSTTNVESKVTQWANLDPMRWLGRNDIRAHNGDFINRMYVSNIKV